jgi:nucleoid DNA-binding protein
MTPIKKWLVRRIAVDTITDERIVDVVISHQFEKAREAINSCNSIELSGLGRFYFNKKKAGRKLERYEMIKQGIEKVIDSDVTDVKRATAQYKLGRLIGDLNALKRKIEHED